MRPALVAQDVHQLRNGPDRSDDTEHGEQSAPDNQGNADLEARSDGHVALDGEDDSHVDGGVDEGEGPVLDDPH